MNRHRLLACVLAVACSAPEVGPPSTAAAPTSATPPRTTPPEARDVIDALLRHKDVKLTHESCRGVTGVEGDDTLGEYVAHLLAQLASAHAEGTKATLRASCAAGPPFRCRLDVAIEAEDPWRYGVHFDLLATGEIPESSIECPGAA